MLDRLDKEEYFYGHKGCGGCGGSLAVRLALKVLGKDTFVVLPAGCMSAVGFVYPQLCFGVNALISPFASTAAMLSGIRAAAKSLNIKNCNVVGFAGDGGTADIGLQALSGAIDRGDKIIYICYDNEAYMNTGVQQSSLTPYGARTTTTPPGEHIHGSRNSKKNMFEIVAAHHIKYAATASIGNIPDYIKKVEKAKNTNGTSYIHIAAPCPTGWGIDSSETVAIAREAVECGLWYLAEYEDGKYKLNKNVKEFTSIRTYLKKQGRFKHLTDEDIQEIERQRDENIKFIKERYI
ncbi:thiamine pyrophosphate-dependent enzyme [Ruminiclostridium papyrosolvens]|uniref:2-ketoisovalerate ferredoxin oxidoreductase subunit beta n=1 Tax=Ruminiclostridium papyrosolvens C7 TaxID=1330534 RepID=U4R5T4_9FIRM|nr:thiamine pyrophosphate-dependent enzyme [Ruminiclostridium papyrosolvens]EPR13795.1 2-ketoisovalerate ferredoxin oxidoreductase subunit beta [Ruminiclostridium papyrosolvens C7]